MSTIEILSYDGIKSAIPMPSSWENLKECMGAFFPTIFADCLGTKELLIWMKFVEGSKHSGMKLNETLFESNRENIMSGKFQNCVIYAVWRIPMYIAHDKRKQGIDVLENEFTELELNGAEELPISFYRSLDLICESVAIKKDKPVKEVRVFVITRSTNTKYDRLVGTEVTKDTLFAVSPSKCGLLITTSKAYSNFTLDDLMGVKKSFSSALLLLNSTIEDFVQSLIENKYNSGELVSAVTSPDVVVPDLENKVQMIHKYLEYFRSIFHADSCYSEANRRIALNCILLPAIAPTVKKEETPPDSKPKSKKRKKMMEFEVSMDAEYLMDLPPKTPRIGNGPLDYFIIAPNITPTIVAAIHPLRIEDEDEEECDEFYKPSGTKGYSLIEAKAEFSAAALSQSLGQLFAQMIDGLKLPTANAVPASASTTTTPAPSNVRFIKGVLSTAQQSMFFSMKQEGDESLPTLEYYGKYSLNFLPHKSGRLSGIDVDEDIDNDELTNLVKAYYFFTRFNYKSY